MSLNAIILRIANISLIELPWSIPAARAQCSPHFHSPWSIVSYPMTHWQRASWTTFILCKWARVPVWLDANLNIATKKTLSSTVEAIHASSETLGTIEQQTAAHLAVIPSFLPFCQQSSPCAGVNVRRVYSGQSSLVLKQSSRGQSLFCQYIGPFVSLDTHMRWNPHQGYVFCMRWLFFKTRKIVWFLHLIVLYYSLIS
jgi:hypothetical protein